MQQNRLRRTALFAKRQSRNPTRNFSLLTGTKPNPNNGDSLRCEVLFGLVSPIWHQKPLKAGEKGWETSEIKFGANY
jgi:hypothetical protein